ncbi:MAG: hypothetical protein IT556_18920 [Acetobacteraceae bacterium]|nr:hypothetical protein [Acetobacteraceae bacterium]
MVPLGEVLTPAGEPHRVETERSYPNLGIYSFARGCFEKPPIDGNLTSAPTLYRVRSGQFIYSRLFAFEGAYAVVPDELDGAFVSNEFPCFDVQRDLALPRYLRWMFSLPRMWASLAEGSKGMGDRRKRVHPEQLLTFQAALPSLDMQRRIVARLDAVEARIAQRQCAVDALDKELAALLAAAFRRITEDAPRARMGDIAPIVRRPITIETDQVYREIGARAFGRGLFEKPPLRGDSLTWQKLFLIEAGDLVISNIKAWEGAFAVADAAHHGAVGSHRYLTSVVDRRRVTPDFAWFFLQSPPGIAQVQAASPGSADRNRTLSQDRFAAIEVPVPPLDAQQWFDALQQKARAAREAQASAAAELDHLVPALLAEAFGSG